MAISMVFILFAVAIVFVLIAVAIAASKKMGVNEEGDKNMMRSLFYYLVLFATLMMTIGRRNYATAMMPW